MRFFVDRCAGEAVAVHLRSLGHDAVWARELGRDPGDRELLTWAANDDRIVITVDKDFGDLVFRDEIPHHGLIRLPDLPLPIRLRAIEQVVTQTSEALSNRAVVTLKSGRIRVRLP